MCQRLGRTLNQLGLAGGPVERIDLMGMHLTINA